MHRSFISFVHTLLILSGISAVVSAPVPRRHLSDLAKRSTSSPDSNSLLEQVLPGWNDAVGMWSTVPGAANALPLSSATLNAQKVSSIPPAYGDFEGKYALKAEFPAGSYRPEGPIKGGLSFYASGPESVKLDTAQAAMFGYSIYFPKGFDFVKGGKLPGLYGGDSPEEALSCSGGRHSPDCFSARLMWRTDGAGELYLYNPGSDPSTGYGQSIDRGSYSFVPGEWTYVSQYLELNDPGQANGKIEVYVNGKLVITKTGLVLRNSAAGKIWGIMVQTFFGGHDASWATPKDQQIGFADFSVAIKKTF